MQFRSKQHRGTCTTSYFEERQDHFVCANYRSNTGTCSAHYIQAVVLEQLVWKHMQYEDNVAGKLNDERFASARRTRAAANAGKLFRSATIW